ncbi:MAG: cyclic nucleotide-binding domain-containing protein [Myxococcaceae bacterium]
MPAVDVFKTCALFKGFTDTGLQILASISTERHFPQGVPLFVENMVGDSLLILSTGRVRLTSKNKTGEEIPVGDAGPGDFLGELALIQQGQRMCTATATAQVSAWEIRHQDFQRLLGQKPQACLKLLMNIVSAFGQKITDNKDTFKLLLTK